MADALEAVEPGHQHLAAPEGAVGPVPEAVERQRDDRVAPLVLDHARGDVCVVVLHRDGGDVEVARQLRRQVLRVEVVRDDLR